METINKILNGIDAATKTYISDTVAILAANLNATFRYLLIVFFIMYGFAVWRGVIKADAIEYFWTVVKISVIYYIIFGTGIYNELIVDWMTNGPNNLGGLIAGLEPGARATDALGKAYDKCLAVVQRVYELAGMRNLMAYIVGTLILFSATIVVLMSVLLLAVSKIALSLLVALGPIAIMLLLFQSTRKFFESWLQQCVNFGLITILTLGIIVLLSALYLQIVDDLSVLGEDRKAVVTLGSVVPLMMYSLVISLILKQVPAIASAIAGGVQLSTLGVESAPGRAMSNVGSDLAQRSMRGGPGLAGRAMKGAASQARRGMKGVASRVAQMVKRFRS